jgi:hypothetical protein
MSGLGGKDAGEIVNAFLAESRVDLHSSDSGVFWALNVLSGTGVGGDTDVLDEGGEGDKRGDIGVWANGISAG